MNKASRFLLSVALLIALRAAARANEYKATLDLAANVKFLDNYFGRYGYSPFQSIARDAKGFWFKLPATAKGLEQTGAYSYFALAGDFEVSAEFELINLAPPQKGQVQSYGVSVGIAVESKENGAQVNLARGNQIKKGNGYLVTEGSLDDEGKMKYRTEHYPSQAKSGRLVLRREKKELICFVADKPKDEPYQLCRVEFNDSTIQKIRVYADTGGSPTALDARITNLQVRANEITGGVPLSEQRRSWAWLWITLAILALPALTYWWWKHKRAAVE